MLRARWVVVRVHVGVGVAVQGVCVRGSGWEVATRQVGVCEAWRGCHLTSLILSLTQVPGSWLVDVHYEEAADTANEVEFA